MAYEYRLIRLQDSPGVEAELNDLGARGWNIAGINDEVVVLRRQSCKPPAPDMPRDDPGRCEIEKGCL